MPLVGLATAEGIEEQVAQGSQTGRLTAGARTRQRAPFPPSLGQVADGLELRLATVAAPSFSPPKMP